MNYNLAKLSPRKGAVLPVIEPSLRAEKAYLRQLRKMLRIIAEAVRSNVLPVAIAELERKARDAKQIVDMDATPFDVLQNMVNSLSNTVNQSVSQIFILESKRHTQTFMQQAKRHMGVDVSAIVSEEDLTEYMETVAARNASLITGLGQDAVRRVQQTITQGVLNGVPVKKLREQLKRDFQISDSRAQLIAQDQVAKFNSDLNRIRHLQAGITDYIWRTARDERVRSRHRTLEGKRYRYDEETGAENGLPPGQPIRCRCIAQPIVGELAPQRAVPRAEPIPPTQQEPVPPPPPPEPPQWGTATDAERQNHNLAFPMAPGYMKTGVQKTPPVKVILDNNAWPHFKPVDAAISMNSDKFGTPTDPRYQNLWRHEYGHHFDYEVGKRIYPNKSYIPGSLDFADEVGSTSRKIGEWMQPEPDEIYGDNSRYVGVLYDLPEGPNRRKALRNTMNRILGNDAGITADDILALNSAWKDENNGSPSIIQNLLAAQRWKSKSFPQFLDTIKRGADEKDIWYVHTLADFLGAITKNRVGYGHELKYYQNGTKGPKSLNVTHTQTTEVVANYFALFGTNIPQTVAAQKMLRTMTPKLLDRIEQWVKENS